MRASGWLATEADTADGSHRNPAVALQSDTGQEAGQMGPDTVLTNIATWIFFSLQ